MLSHKRREKTDLKSVNKTLHVNKTKNPHVVSSSPPFPPFLFPLVLYFSLLAFVPSFLPFPISTFSSYHHRPLLSLFSFSHFAFLLFLPCSLPPTFLSSFHFPFFLPHCPLSLKPITNNGKQTVDQAIRKKKPLHRLRVFKIRARNAAGGGAHLLDIREKIRAFAAGPYADLESVFKIKDGRENAKFFLL